MRFIAYITLVQVAALLPLASIVGCSSGLPRQPIAVDTDGDRLYDACEEDLFLTDPNNADTDGDTLEDWAEDHDGDGCNNFVELGYTNYYYMGAYRCSDYVPEEGECG